MSFLDELADRFGVPYRFARLPHKCRAYLINGAAVISDDLTPEQAHWSYCHELAHFLLGHHQDLPPDDAEERRQEAEANRLAAEILLPKDQFAAVACQPLAKLKRAFPHVSHEVIARRRIRFRPGLLTIYDNGKLTARIAPDNWNVPAQLFPLELRALKECLASKGEIEIREEGISVEGTYVDEGRGVVRVILFTESEER